MCIYRKHHLNNDMVWWQIVLRLANSATIVCKSFLWPYDILCNVYLRCIACKHIKTYIMPKWPFNMIYIVINDECSSFYIRTFLKSPILAHIQRKHWARNIMRSMRLTKNKCLEQGAISLMKFPILQDYFDFAFTRTCFRGFCLDCLSLLPLTRRRPF